MMDSKLNSCVLKVMLGLTKFLRIRRVTSYYVVGLI
jgi:hypothetical protein